MDFGQLHVMLTKQRLIDFSVREVFPRPALERLRLLAKAGFHLRRDQTIDRFRVVNDKNIPKLLVLKGSERYGEISRGLLETTLNSLNGVDV